jgi:hypothetical protein
MVKRDGGLEFMLIDFEWAGNNGEVRYPRHVNKAPELGRPQDVEDGVPILGQYDLILLNMLQ